MSTNFKEQFRQFGTDTEQLRDGVSEIRNRLSRVEQSGGGGSGGGGGESPWHDITDYGASGDGSAADTDEVQSAIDAAGRDGGGIVYFPAGDYKVTRALIGREGVTLRGEGRYQAVIHQDDPNEHGVDLEGAGNLSVEGIGITHDHGLAEQERGQCLFSGAALENVVVQECSFYEPARQAVGLWSSGNRNIRFVDNDLRDCARAGVVIFGEGIAVDDNYILGTGDDAIALNTDNTTHCTISGNIIIEGAGRGEQTGGAVKFHGRNTSVSNNIIIDANQYAIRGQVVDSASGKQTDISPTRNTISENIIHGLTDINPNTKARAAIEMRELQHISIHDNTVSDIPGYIGILLRNDDENDTVAKLNNNYIKNAERAVQVEDRHGFIDISDTTPISVGQVLRVRGPVETLHFRGGTGHDIGSCVSFSGVDSGSYHLRGNWFTGVSIGNVVDGSLDGGTVTNYLNVPSGATSRVRSNADYDAVRWSDVA